MSTTNFKIDLITISENGIVHVRSKSCGIDDGGNAWDAIHRYVVAPGQDYSNEPDAVKAACAKAHTEKVVAAYKDAMLKSQTVDF